MSNGYTLITIHELKAYVFYAFSKPSSAKLKTINASKQVLFVIIIATVPSSTLVLKSSIVLPHLNAMCEEHNITPTLSQCIEEGLPVVVLSLSSVTLATTTLLNLFRVTRPRNQSLTETHTKLTLY